MGMGTEERRGRSVGAPHFLDKNSVGDGKAGTEERWGRSVGAPHFLDKNSVGDGDDGVEIGDEEKIRREEGRWEMEAQAEPRGGACDTVTLMSRILGSGTFGMLEMVSGTSN